MEVRNPEEATDGLHRFGAKDRPGLADMFRELAEAHAEVPKVTEEPQ